ncbi:MAG: hypothetical protein NTW86_18120 [Candidatus Sumerlaeota bacterium]|nr:hypothetical protein [Candidatus Sumerlaeota bacterium]
MTDIAEREKVLAALRGELQVRLAPMDVVPDEEHIRCEDDWWYIPVWPARRVGDVFRYYQGLAEVETGLEDRLKIHVLLLPSERPAKPQKH